jgi:hypothetical protein
MSGAPIAVGKEAPRRNHAFSSFQSRFTVSGEILPSRIAELTTDFAPSPAD